MSEAYAETVIPRTPIAPTGDTVLVANSLKFNVRVEFKTREVQIGRLSEERSDKLNSSCTYSRYPCSIVDRIIIEVSQKSLFVPRSVFCDLADLNSAEVNLEQKEWVLILNGGDASESYVVKIWFDAERVKQKSLSSSIAPNEPLQVTVYHQHILDN